MGREGGLQGRGKGSQAEMAASAGSRWGAAQRGGAFSLKWQLQQRAGAARWGGQVCSLGCPQPLLHNLLPHCISENLANMWHHANQHALMPSPSCHMQARERGHMHIADLVINAHKFHNERILLTHFSPRCGRRCGVVFRVEA